MNFQEWMAQNTEWMASSFAKSNDPKAIRDVLRKVNLLWETQLQQTLGMQEDIRIVVRMIDELTKE